MPVSQIPLQTRIFSDIDVSMNANPITGDVLQVTGVNSVVQSIMNLVQTNHYERQFHSEIGGNIRALLFELDDSVTTNLISEEIKDVIANFEPRATVIDVFVESVTNGEMNGYAVEIVFSVTGVTTPVSVSVFLTRLR